MTFLLKPQINPCSGRSEILIKFWDLILNILFSIFKFNSIEPQSSNDGGLSSSVVQGFGNFCDEKYFTDVPSCLYNFHRWWTLTGSLTLRRPLRKKLRMRWFFDISKVKESIFFKIGPHWPPSDFWCASFGKNRF